MINSTINFEQSPGYRKYEVDVARCYLATGDRVVPDTVIGFHHSTSQPVTAGLSGLVATMYFNPMHDSLMIMVVDPVHRN
jgi:hypothetical protein